MYLATETLPPVFVSHGILDTSGTMAPIADMLRAAGRVVYSNDFMPNTGKRSIREYALQLKDFIATTVGFDEPIDMVGFSMGGFIMRTLIQLEGGAEFTRAFVSISSPHQGTQWSSAFKGLSERIQFQGIADMSCNSELVKQLSETDHLRENIRCTTVRTEYDLIIRPTESSILVGADNHVVNELAHPWMITSKKVHALILEGLK